MNGRNVNIKDIKLKKHTQKFSRFFHDPEFVDIYGEEIWDGDIVFFKTINKIFKGLGNISTYKYLKISHFNKELNKWQYYPIEL